jgi:hypothetical protein
MKLFLTFLFLSVCIQIAPGQIPNASFESWTDGQPDNWTTNNVSGIYTVVSRSTTAYAGSYSLYGIVTSYFTNKIPPVVQAGSGGAGFAVSQQYTAVTGNYQFTPVSGDRLTLNFLLYKGGLSGTVTAAGAQIITAATSGWQSFNVPFITVSSDVPDLCTLEILLVGPTGADYHVGSSMLIDNLAFSNATGVGKGPAGLPKNFALMQNYPNPFNPSTTIAFDLPVQSQVTLKLYDLLGREVAVLFQNQIMQAGSHSTQWNASAQPSGVYFVRLTAGNFSAMRKLILLK